MKLFATFTVLLALCCLAFGQGEEKLIIDEYLVETSPLVIIISNVESLPITQTAFTQDNSILGGERDLILEVSGGSAGQVTSSGVSGNSWFVATPNGASGWAVVQYDGIDGSEDLNPDGLGGIDLTANSANAFQFRIQSDLPTEYTIGVFTEGGYSYYTLAVQGGNDVIPYEVPFSGFPGPVDFTRVGAIAVELKALTNVDAIIARFTTWGPVVVSPSPSPSQTPSSSPTPTPTPSRTPAPIIDWYTFDDDDEGKSPCGDEPNRITYFLPDNDVVYYFYAFSEPSVLSTKNSAVTLFSGATLTLVMLLVNLF